jgi:hypothetical protein
MSDNHQQPGIVGAVSNLGNAALKVLPPAFVLLILVNAFFLGFILWFLDSQMESRMKIAMALLEKCFDLKFK